jgi:hypothetical protein
MQRLAESRQNNEAWIPYSATSGKTSPDAILAQHCLPSFTAFNPLQLQTKDKTFTSRSRFPWESLPNSKAGTNPVAVPANFFGPNLPAADIPAAAADRCEAVSFPKPGAYLVICGARTHFLGSMYGFVIVLP